MTIEEYLAEWLKQPGTSVTASQKRFIQAMRIAAAEGTGYGWMQQMIELEWRAKLKAEGFFPESGA